MIRIITISLIAFSLVVLTKNVIASMVFLGITAFCLWVWTATKISSLRKMNRPVEVKRFVLLNLSPFLVAGAVGLSYFIAKAIIIPGIMVAVLALSLLISASLKLLGQGKSERLIDKQVIGLFVALLFIDFIVCIILMLSAGLGHSVREGKLVYWKYLTSFILIVVCPLAAVILSRYYRRSSPENLWKAKFIILGTVLTLSMIGVFLVGRLGVWPLMVYAARNDYKGLEKRLIEAGFDVNAKDRYNGWTPLMFACSRGDIEMAKLLLEKGAKNTPDAFTEASVKGQAGIINLLLEKGADINSRTSFGMTPIMFAVRYVKAYNRLDAVKLLIEKGADLTAKDNSGKSVLMYACEGSHSGVVRLLIEQEPFRDADLSHCQDAFFDASSNGDLAMVRTFLERGMDVNSQDGFRMTALMTASMRGHRDIVEYLLIKGADVNKIALRGKTALSLAVEGGHFEVRDLLLEYGANQ